MSAFRPIALIGGLVFLTSCAYIPGEEGFTSTLLSGLSRGKCSTEHDKHLQGVDWEKARKLPLRIRQGDFRPTFMGLYMNTAYELAIENADDTSHTFRAMEFFRAVAVAGVKDAKDEEKIAAALEKVGKMPSDPENKESPTYAELIADGKLPGGTLEEVKKEPKGEEEAADK